MTKADMFLQAGKQLVVVAAGRAFRGEPLKTHAEDLVNDPAASKQGDKLSPALADKESLQDPGNPNAVNHDDQDPGQEKG